MSESFDVDNNGEIIRVEVSEDGEVYFHDFDPDLEAAAEELGFSPSNAYRLWQAIQRFGEAGDPAWLDDELISACSDGRIGLVQPLIAVGADPHAKGNVATKNAAIWGHTDILLLLLENYGTTQFLDRFSLELAIERGHLAVVETLLPLGTFDSFYKMAIRCARNYNQPEIEQLLIAAQATPGRR